MKEHKITCITCPRGCKIKVYTDEKNNIIKIEGNNCNRGAEYVKNEITHPVRVLTSTVRTKSGNIVSVKSEKPIPKEKMLECVDIIKKTIADDEIKIGDIIIDNIAKTNINIIATRNS